MSAVPNISGDDFVNAVERLVLSQNKSLPSGDVLTALLAHVGTEDDEEFNMASVREDASLAVDEMLSVIERRQVSLGDAYPVRLENGAIVPSPNWKNGNAYIFLRLMRFDNNPPHSMREAFETTATSAVASFFRGKMIRTGDPQRPPVPSLPKDFVDYVSVEIGDGSEHNPKAVYPTSGDLSIDGFVYHYFDEPTDRVGSDRTQRLVIVVNCATGKTWPELNKPYEPIVSNAKHFFSHWVSPTWPVFCVPDFDISTYDRQQVGAANTLIFGGWRISRWGTILPPVAKDWVNETLASIPQHLSSLPFPPV